MNMTCKDLERVLREQLPEEIHVMHTHARDCAACRTELAAWNEISAGAQAMHREWDSPNLWPRIHQQLAEEGQRVGAPAKTPFWAGWTRQWQLAAAAFALVALTVISVWMLRRPETPDGNKIAGPGIESKLLTEKAVADIQNAEKAYIESIQKLEKLTGSKVANPNSSLLANYREKLMLIDSAIAECRGQADMNPANSQLRKELLSMYQEKQKTLEELVKEAPVPSNPNQN